MMDLKLFPFQKETISRFTSLPSVLLGDDMGLGKTVQAVVLDKAKRVEHSTKGTNGKTLVITPLGVLYSWWKHFTLWSNLRAVTISNKNREDFLSEIEIGDYDVYICHWPGIRLMPELRNYKWFHIIGDEIHTIQNRNSQVTRNLKYLQAKFKTGLSGTPAYAKPDDLWSVLNWLYPRYWSSYWTFFDRYVLSTERSGYLEIIGSANEEELQRQIRGYFIRRQKEDVLTDLPDKYFTKIQVELTPKQRKAYNQMKKDMLTWVGENEDQPINAIKVVAQLTRLQQFASAYAEVVDGNVRLSNPSSKIDEAARVITSTGQRLVVFSQFSQLIDLLIEKLKKVKVDCGKYTGAVSMRERDRIIEDFRDERIQVFAGTYAAGGTGIDGLQVSNTVISMDRPWVQPVFEQGIDRLHRYGQKNAVQVIEIEAADTIETKRTEDIEMRWGWVQQMLGD